MWNGDSERIVGHPEVGISDCGVDNSSLVAQRLPIPPFRPYYARLVQWAGIRRRAVLLVRSRLGGSVRRSPRRPFPGSFSNGGSSTSRRCGQVDRYRTLARLSVPVPRVQLACDGQG